MTGEQLIDYDALAQDAMRGIVRTVLQRVAALGRLPGDHHFYIAFDTRAPGVVVSKRLKQRYPEEMTIVLQHQFRELTVDDEKFEVTLSFGSVPERLSVPLRAVRVFFDPSVAYGLQFDGSDLAAKSPSGEARANGAAASERQAAADPGSARSSPAGEAAADAAMEPALPAKARSPRKPRSAPSDAAGEMPALPTGTGEPADAALPRAQSARPKLVRSTPDVPANDAKVVQLDKFRKK
jgi:hypothetical protein